MQEFDRMCQLKWGGDDPNGLKQQKRERAKERLMKVIEHQLDKDGAKNENGFIDQLFTIPSQINPLNGTVATYRMVGGLHNE